jgi:hypothetical protein
MPTIPRFMNRHAQGSMRSFSDTNRHFDAKEKMGTLLFF